MGIFQFCVVDFMHFCSKLMRSPNSQSTSSPNRNGPSMGTVYALNVRNEPSGTGGRAARVPLLWWPSFPKRNA